LCTKSDCLLQVANVGFQLQGLMEKNKTVPDIEKLQHHDFDLDVDEQHRLQATGDAEVSRVSIASPGEYCFTT